jgi:hypothetical protein
MSGPGAGEGGWGFIATSLQFIVSTAVVNLEMAWCISTSCEVTEKHKQEISIYTQIDKL